MTRLIQSAKDLRATMPGWVALILAAGCTVALVGLVLRGTINGEAPKGLSEWGIIIGLFLQCINGLLTEAQRHTARATDPLVVPGRTTTTVEVEEGP